MVNKKKNNDDKRERILKAATQTFAQHGFYKSTISEIANLANVADGTIYLYFKNKDDLLISLFEEEMMKIIDHSLKEGYTGVGGSDVSEKGFSWKNGVAIVPDKEAPELAGLEQSRWEKMTDKEKEELLYKFHF